MSEKDLFWPSWGLLTIYAVTGAVGTEVEVARYIGEVDETLYEKGAPAPYHPPPPLQVDLDPSSGAPAVVIDTTRAAGDFERVRNEPVTRPFWDKGSED